MTAPWTETVGARIVVGDCRSVLADLADASVDAVVTDPPYGLSNEPDVADVLRRWLAGEDYVHLGRGFMGEAWDGFVPGPDVWRECRRALKPGGYLLCFAGTRTFDLAGIALRLAEFEIRDTIDWLYGTGFPKSMAIAGTPGWGTALKPAHEPIIMARKPLDGTVAANVAEHGTGAINIDASRVPGDVVAERGEAWARSGKGKSRAWHGTDYLETKTAAERTSPLGRFPTNVVLSHADDCGSGCSDGCPVAAVDGLGPSRFFYRAKTSKVERQAGMPDGLVNDHPTVKPVALMRYLVDMVTPPAGTVLDPYMGTGSTGVAAITGGFAFIGIDKDPRYVDLATHRLRHARP